jgi:hypothetical protein
MCRSQNVWEITEVQILGSSRCSDIREQQKWRQFGRIEVQIPGNNVNFNICVQRNLKYFGTRGVYVFWKNRNSRLGDNRSSNIWERHTLKPEQIDSLCLEVKVMIMMILSRVSW